MNGTGHGATRARALWAQLGPAGRVALGAAAVAALVVLLSSRSFLGALLTSPAATPGVAQDQQQQAERFAKSFDGHLAQIDGRSVFFIPPRPYVPATHTNEGPKGPQVPTHYAGPALIGFANGAAYFADGKKLLPDGPAEGSLKVKSIHAPWNVVVEWEGVEFTVNLFDHDKIVLADKKDPAAPELPKPEAKPEARADTKTEAKAEPKPAPSTATPDTPPPGPPPPAPESTPEQPADPR